MCPKPKGGQTQEFPFDPKEVKRSPSAHAGQRIAELTNPGCEMSRAALDLRAARERRAAAKRFSSDPSAAPVHRSADSNHVRRAQLLNTAIGYAIELAPPIGVLAVFAFLGVCLWVFSPPVALLYLKLLAAGVSAISFVVLAASGLQKLMQPTTVSKS